MKTRKTNGRKTTEGCHNIAEKCKYRLCSFQDGKLDKNVNCLVTNTGFGTRVFRISVVATTQFKRTYSTPQNLQGVLSVSQAQITCQ